MRRSEGGLRKGLPARLNFRGQSVSLEHLRPFTHLLEGHGQGGSDLVVRVTFESHVFSVSEGDGLHDFLDESGNRRFFSEGRYSFSLGLAVEVRRILELNVFTWEEKDRNRVSNLAVLAPADRQLVSGRHDVLIYYLYRSRVEGIHVEMRVKTCYAKEIDFGKRLRREKIRVFLKTICFKGGRLPKT